MKPQEVLFSILLDLRPDTCAMMGDPGKRCNDHAQPIRAYSDFHCHRGRHLPRVALDRQVLPTFLQANPGKSSALRVRHHAGIRRARRYTVRFYVVAILFVVFEVETVFLYPWAVEFQVLGLLGLVEMLVFLGILVVGYIWLWNRGALKWI